MCWDQGSWRKKLKKQFFAVENPDYDEFDIPEERYDIVTFGGKFSIEKAIENLKVQKLDSGTITMSPEEAKAEPEESKEPADKD